MVIEIRPCQTPEEVAQYDAMGAYVFADPPIATPETQTSADWTLCAFDDGKVVSQVGAFPFTVRLNGAPVPMAGVTMVGTLPHYRRQGLVRKLMTRAFNDMRERNQPLAILWASMGAIYQRFGYGIASSSVRYTFDPRFAGLQEPFEAAGRISLESAEEAYPVIKQIYVEYASPRNLHIHRSRALWQASTLRAGEKTHPVHVATYRTAEGRPTGYAVYQLVGKESTAPGPNQRLIVQDFVALDLEAFKAIWEFLRSHDLVGEIQIAGALGEDDVAPELLLEPRMLNKRVSDGIWMRVVDAEKALAARPYGDRGELTIAIEDSMCPWNSGTYLLETDGITSDVHRKDRPADLAVTPNALATLLAGHRTATHLARAGRPIRIFRTEYAPNCPNSF
jgi:predicted acetyltransferase